MASKLCAGVLICLIGWGWLQSAKARAQTPWFAEIVSIQGTVMIKHKDSPQWRQASLNERITIGDVLRVESHGRVALMLPDQAILRLDQNTTITFREEKKHEASLLELLKGAVHYFSTEPGHLKIITPFVNAAVEGTEFLVRVDPEQTQLSVLQGRISAENRFGALVVETGQTVVAEKEQAPQLRLELKPRDAVAWTLYYLPVLDLFSLLQVGGLDPSARRIFERSVRAWVAGSTSDALRALSALPKPLKDARYYTFQGALLLSVGSVMEADEDLRRALTLKPSDPVALALKAVISLAQNDKEQALHFVEEALVLEPESTAALIALSYVRQAQFDIPKALDAVQAVVKIRPDNALAWARISELELGLGKLREALDAARQAAKLSPQLARVQTVLGFAYLSQIKIRAAEQAFREAIELDSADPLPRLGLGLALIRSGDLGSGRKQIEIAAGLDPLNSIYRSYLGKAYYEEKRDGRAFQQLALAKDLDPLDPTPWLYDAILKQTVNRPIEAMEDLQKSIALNDNRAVYRSRLLLDQDLATRSADLARIYEDVGFEQAALVEGWQSLNTDPANFSAHRFLADSYAALPRHEIARVSELLQSQLLQPININPVQPQLAEKSLSFARGAGPTSPSYSEYSPLFDRNGINMQLSGIAGSNNTLGNELVASGIHDNLSYSLGQYYYQTDGFRENDDFDQQLYDAFLQVALSPQTSLQGEYRYGQSDEGDLSLLFDPEDYSDSLRQNERTDSFRLGFHQELSPGFHVLASWIYRDIDGGFGFNEPVSDQVPNWWFANDSDVGSEGWQGEAQMLRKGSRINWIAGLGTYKGHSRTVVDESLQYDDYRSFQASPQKDESDNRYSNFYFYSYLNGLNDSVTLTLGASLDLYNGELSQTDQFNPKLGLSWRLFRNTMLRAAAFRTLKRDLITDQTLEPTQVAGFNQFYDDANGTSVWIYGVALDQKLRNNLFAGVELSERHLDDIPYRLYNPVAQLLGSTTEVEETDWKEKVARAYLYWAPHKWLSLTAESLYEKFYHDPEGMLGEGNFIKLRTVRVPLGLNFYHPSGLSFQLKATYVDQKIETLPQDGSPHDEESWDTDSDHFWVLDAAFNYRLPKRFGMLTFGVNNLLNEDYHFQDTDPSNPDIVPGRTLFGKFTLVF